MGLAGRNRGVHNHSVRARLSYKPNRKDVAMFEPTDLELRMHERLCIGLVTFGPLTATEQDKKDSYYQYCAEAEAEEQARIAAGGRTICPTCGERSVKSSAVIMLGYAGHPGAEYSTMYECERCDYREI